MKIQTISHLFVASLTIMVMGVSFSNEPQLVSARGIGPELTIIRVDSSKAPDYTIQTSVLDGTAASLPDLNNTNFELSDNIDKAQKIPITGVQSINAGIAVAIVADLGGLGGARPSSDYGKPNNANVEALARDLVSKLSGAGNNPDYVGLITLVGEGTDPVKIDPSATIDMTPDPVAIANTLDKLKTINIGKATALFDGVERAMDMLSKNPNAAVKTDLDLRRKVVVVFSDGSDDKFSNQSFLSSLADRARKDRVSIFAIQVNKPDNPRATSNMQALAKQGEGGYALYDDSIPQAEAEAKIQALYKIILSQRTQYVLPFRMAKPSGEFTTNLKVTTKDGTSDNTDVKLSSKLKSPIGRITSPTNGTVFEQKEDTPISMTLSADVAFGDNPARPVSIEFIVDGKSVGKANTSPYQFDWKPPPEIRQTDAITVNHTVGIILNDPLLNLSNTGETVNYSVKVSTLPPIAPEGWYVWALKNLPLLIGLCGIGLFSSALLLLLLLLNSRNTNENKKLRQQLSILQNLQNQGGIGGVVRSITQRLGIGAAGQKAYAEIKVLSGPHKDISFAITEDVTSVGRDSTSGPGMLSLSSDPYISGKHLEIRMQSSPNNPQANTFSIIHTSNNNPSVVNGMQLQPGISYPLASDSTIEIGQSKLKFQIGRPTTRLPLPTQLAQP